MRLVDAGNTLKQFRDIAGLTQREVAERVGVKSQTVSQWERGDAHPMRAKVIRLDEMFGAEGQLLAAYGYAAPGELDRLAAHVMDLHSMIQALNDRVRQLESELHPDPPVDGQRSAAELDDPIRY